MLIKTGKIMKAEQRERTEESDRKQESGEQAATSVQEVTAYLSAIPKFGENVGLTTVTSIYQALGMPAGDIPVIHVAGTNGKGSVCAFLCNILREAGFHVGMFTSPHLVDIRERIQLDLQMISEQDFVSVFYHVRRQLEKGKQPSYFEMLYLMAMQYYAEKKPDFIILETGLGGRLDATNAYPNPVLSIVTRIGMDHMQYLGNTLVQIAGEKAGIAKSCAPLVFLDSNREVSEVMRLAAQKAHTQAVPVYPSGISMQLRDDKNIDFCYDTGYYGCKSFSLSTCAGYQAENAALALTALSVLERAGRVKLTEAQLQGGLKKTHWAGRMEQVIPGIYVDGAHNPDGVRAFLETVASLSRKENEKRMLLFSVVADKDYQEMIARIQDSGLFDMVLIAPLETSRHADLTQITCYFDRIEHLDFTSVKDAFTWVLMHRQEEDTVFAAGSLYLVGELKALLLVRDKEKADR